MRALCIVALTFMILWAGSVPAVQAHKSGDAPHQIFAMGDLTLESGQSIEDFKLSYVTHGTLNAAKNNAVLMLAPFSGNHHHNEYLVGKGKAFDTDAFFVICVDPIGNGLSTSPSNSTTQWGSRFPAYAIIDMVRAQQRLLTEFFGITKLFAVTGASMGGMQSLQWAVLYPQSVERVVALVPAARTSPWMHTMLELQRQAIMLDPVWNKGEYTQQPDKGLRLWAGLLFGFAVTTPEAVNAKAEGSTKEGARILAFLQGAGSAGVDANNVLSQIGACTDFDLGATPGFDGDVGKALAAITAKTLIVLGENDLIVPEGAMARDAAHIPRVTLARVKGPVPFGHRAGTDKVAAEYIQKVIADFLVGE